MPRVLKPENVSDINIRDPYTKTLVRKLAAIKHLNLTETIRIAAESELRRETQKEPLYSRLAPLRARYRAMPDTGLPADKAFYDDLSGEL